MRAAPKPVSLKTSIHRITTRHMLISPNASGKSNLAKTIERRNERMFMDMTEMLTQRPDRIVLRSKDPSLRNMNPFIRVIILIKDFTLGIPYYHFALSASHWSIISNMSFCHSLRDKIWLACGTIWASRAPRYPANA